MTAHTYLVTIVATDAHPDEAMERHQRDTVDGVSDLLYPYLYRHGAKPVWNAQMAQEADPAIEALDHWRRDPRQDTLHLCGYLTRYDIDRVPVCSGATWESERANELRCERETHACEQLARHVPALASSDQFYAQACSWVATGEASTSFSDRHAAETRARRLGECWDLAVELRDAGLLPAVYTLASWSLATARTGDSMERIRGDLAAEVVGRQTVTPRR